MLHELILQNFVLIKDAHIQLSPGFNVFTGETGAGKSLLVRAVRLLMGDRADPSLIYPGETVTRIEGVFEIPRLQGEILQQQGIEAHDELIVRRLIPRTGRSRAYVNGTPVTLVQLREVTRGLLSIAGQHEYQGLMRPGNYVAWLDLFGGLKEQRTRVHELHRRYNELLKKRETTKKEIQALRQEKERLKEELSEIDQVAPKEGEEARLLEEIGLMRSATTRRELAQEAYNLLYGAKDSCQGILSKVMSALQQLSQLDAGLKPLEERCEAALIEVQELGHELRDYHSSVDVDPNALDQLESRLNSLRRLLLRFGPTEADCIQYRETLKGRLKLLEEPRQVLEAIEDELATVSDMLSKEAQELSRMRTNAARDLERALQKELSDLFPNKALLKVKVVSPQKTTPERVGPNGQDTVEFLFQPNPGQSMKPVHTIASGGELSRITLGLRAVLALSSHEETVLFDEIDAGIGGETANLVGAKLSAISSKMQVLCVSHFPQVASKAHAHFVVEKRQDGHRTWTEIYQVKDDARAVEVARMLGGTGEKAISYAKRLLSRGEGT